MVSFIVRTEKLPSVEDFFLFVNSRLSENNVVLNPFSNSFVRLFISDNHYFLSFVLNPVYPKTIFSYIFLFVSIIIFLFKGFSFWLFFPALVYSVILFLWSKYFFYFVFRRSLKSKFGYNGSLCLVHNFEGVEFFASD